MQENLVVTEADIQGHELFNRCLEQKRLPSALDPLTFIEAVDHPDHFPTAAAMLQLFGTSNQTTHAHEFHASHLPEQSARTVKSQNQRLYPGRDFINHIRYRLTHSPRISPRLQRICRAHSHGDWEGQGEQLYYAMSEKIGPSLHYTFDLDPPNNHQQPGDYNQIIQYLKRHWHAFERIFFNQGDILTASYQIARGHRVHPQPAAIDQLLTAMNDLLGPPDLKAVRVSIGDHQGKGKEITDAASDPFPRAGSTNITHQFKQWFVDLDPQNLKAVQRITGESSIGRHELEFFASHMNRLHLLLLGSLADDQAKYQPLSRLAQLLYPNNPEQLARSLASYQDIVTSPLSPIDKSMDMKAIDPNLDNQSLSKTLDILQTRFQEGALPGFGAARALLVHYTQLRLSREPTDNHQADKLEQLMHHLNRLASDPAAIDKFQLDQLFET